MMLTDDLGREQHSPLMASQVLASIGSPPRPESTGAVVRLFPGNKRALVRSRLQWQINQIINNVDFGIWQPNESKTAWMNPDSWTSWTLTAR